MPILISDHDFLYDPKRILIIIIENNVQYFILGTLKNPIGLFPMKMKLEMRVIKIQKLHLQFQL